MYYIYVDEAGRWPIAWPVYVGVVIEHIKTNVQITNHKAKSTKKATQQIKNYNWKNATDHLSLFGKYKWYDDSKVFNEAQREVLYEKICADKTIFFASWSSNSTEVDNKWIVWGIRNSIAKAIYKWLITNDKLLIKNKRSEIKDTKYTSKKFISWIQEHVSEIALVIDGKTDFGIRKLWGVEVETIVDGDAIVPMISAASIVAKVERDTEMIKHHKKYPQYGFERHKGYGTKAHYAAIEKHGMSKLHRKSFLKKLLLET